METYILKYYYKSFESWHEAIAFTKAGSSEEAKERLKNDPFLKERELDIQEVQSYTDKDLENNIWCIYEQ